MKWIVGVSIIAVVVGAAATMTIPAQAIVPDQAILRLFPPETQGIAYFDMAALRDTALFQDVLATGGVPNFGGLRDFAEATGFVVQRDLDRLTVGRIGDRNSLAIAEARYDMFKVERFFTDKGIYPETYMGRALFRRDPTTVAFVDTLVIAGSSANVRKAVERLSLPGNLVLKPELLSGIQTIAAGSQVWAAGEFSLDHLPVPAGAASPALDVLKTLRGGTYQMRVDRDVHARATGNLADPDSARNLADLARGMVALVKLRVAQNEDLLHALDGVQIQNSGSSIVVNIEESGELLKRLKDLRPKLGALR